MPLQAGKSAVAFGPGDGTPARGGGFHCDAEDKSEGRASCPPAVLSQRLTLDAVLCGGLIREKGARLRIRHRPALPHGGALARGAALSRGDNRRLPWSQIVTCFHELPLLMLVTMCRGMLSHRDKNSH